MTKIRVLGGTIAALALTAAGAIPALASPGQEAVDLTTSTADALAQQLVAGDIEISNVTFTGNAAQAGSFTGMGAGLGIDSGVVLSTGPVVGADSALFGPNAGNASNHLGSAGDDDLSGLVEGLKTYDAGVLEFDFVPNGSMITFSYVFGSEEYNEYVGDEFNDVFAFYVNGENYATIDGANGTVPVAINNVNNDLNADFYIDNTGGAKDTGLDGLTTVLSFSAPVKPNETNHLKLAIADASDSALDSLVAIQAGSLKVNEPPVADDQTATTTPGTAVELELKGSDPDGDELSYSIVDPVKPEHGTLEHVSGATWKFTPAAGFMGDATFTYLANDGKLDSKPATFTVTVAEATEEPTQEPTGTAEPSEEPTGTAEPTSKPTTAPSSTSKPGLATTGSEGVNPLAIVAAAGLVAAGAALLRRRVRG